MPEPIHKTKSPKVPNVGKEESLVLIVEVVIQEPEELWLLDQKANNIK